MGDLVSITPENGAADVIACLERALDVAREGRVSSVAVCLVYRDGVLGHKWSFLPSYGLMLGCATRLVYKLNTVMGDDPEPDPDSRA